MITMNCVEPIILNSFFLLLNATSTAPRRTKKKDIRRSTLTFISASMSERISIISVVRLIIISQSTIIEKRKSKIFLFNINKRLSVVVMLRFLMSIGYCTWSGICRQWPILQSIKLGYIVARIWPIEWQCHWDWTTKLAIPVHHHQTQIGLDQLVGNQNQPCTITRGPFGRHARTDTLCVCVCVSFEAYVAKTTGIFPSNELRTITLIHYQIEKNRLLNVCSIKSHTRSVYEWKGKNCMREHAGLQQEGIGQFYRNVNKTYACLCNRELDQWKGQPPGQQKHCCPNIIENWNQHGQIDNGHANKQYVNNNKLGSNGV